MNIQKGKKKKKKKKRIGKIGGGSFTFSRKVQRGIRREKY